MNRKRGEATMLALVVGEAATDRYALEVLSHAGIPFRLATPQTLHPDRTPLCLMAGRRHLTAEERARLVWFVQQGGCLIAVGDQMAWTICWASRPLANSPKVGCDFKRFKPRHWLLAIRFRSSAKGCNRRCMFSVAFASTPVRKRWR